MSVRVVLLSALIAGCLSFGAEPWAVSFSPDSKALLEAAKKVAVADDQSVVLLLEDHAYRIDGQGRTRSVVRKVYRILKEDAVDEWSSVEQSYQPWYEDKPVVRARVITADGTVHPLDPATLAESPAQQFEANVFSDRRVLQAPLPAVATGAVVEYEITTTERAPLLDAGVVRRVLIYDGIPVTRFHLTIDADATISLETTARMIPGEAIRRSTTGGRTTVECELGPLAVRKDFEGNLPPEVASYPYFAFSTGKSWQAIAKRYSEIVDRQLAGAAWDDVLDGMDRGGSPMAIATRLAARLHKQIRYTGVEFGEAAIVPNRPADVLQRKYGDCKDKATLLVGMLRAAGLKAYVALLDSGFDTDLDVGLPGMGRFDHAIVYVGGDAPFWIDATASDVRIGKLPSADEGRLALIARPESIALERTPESKSTDNPQVHTIEVKMSDFGGGSFVERMDVSGGRESELRTLFGADEKQAKESLTPYVKQNYLGKLGKFEAMKKDDLSGPFHMTVEAVGALRANTVLDDAAVAIFPHLAFEELPFSLIGKLEDEPGIAPDKDKKDRKNDFLLPYAHTQEFRYRIIPPPDFKPAKLPPAEDVKLGPARYVRTCKTNSDGSVEAIVRFDSGPRRWTAADVETFRRDIKEHYQRAAELITFSSEISEHVALGEAGKAIALAQAAVRRMPDNGSARARLSRLLITAGMGGAALAEARRATEVAPKSSQAWQALGWAYQSDAFGRRFNGDWNPQKSEEAYRKAVELDPDDYIAKADLAILLEHNAFGFRYGKGARLADAIALYREVLKKQPNPMLEQNLAVDLLYSGKIDEAATQLKKCSAELQTSLTPVITALKEGAARAIINAQTVYVEPGARAQHLLMTAFTLVQMRRYELATPVFAAAARTANTADVQARADVMAKLKRYEDILVPPTDPTYPMQQLTLELFRGDVRLDRVKGLVTSRERWTGVGNNLSELPSEVSVARRTFSGMGLNGENVIDFVLSLVAFEKEGDDARGYRVKALAPGSASMPALYVVKEDGQYRILGMNGELEHIGALVLELIGKKDLQSAQWWLDKIVGDVTAGEDGTGYPAVHSVWSSYAAPKSDTRGSAAAAVAAHSLIARDTGAEKSIQELKDARLKAATTLEKSQFDKAICEGLTKAKKWDDLMVVAKHLAASKTFPEEGFRYEIKAATGGQKWAELEAIARLRLQVVKENDAALRAIAVARVKQGDAAGAMEWAKKLTALRSASTDQHVFESWIALLADKANNGHLDQLKKSAENSSSASKDLFYTTAMLQVTVGKADDAAQSLRRAVDLEDYNSLDTRAWAIESKIARAYALDDEAAACAERARKAKHDGEMAGWALLMLK